MLQQVLIDVLSRFDIEATCVKGRPGAWTRGGKIAAIGVRVSRGVTTHGFALNVNTDLSYFDNIIPCGISDATVTSMERELSAPLDMHAVQDVIAETCVREFNVDLIEAEAPAALEVLVGR
jgi:lipoyl(octanoyl) transferase